MTDVYSDPYTDGLRAERAATLRPEGAPAPSRSVANIVNWTGGLVSLALIAGTAVWGYKLLVRDVTGVPVVRALEGPMRPAPDDPGGDMAEHQGLAVNRVAAEGTAGGPADQVILAPPPLALAPEDLPRPRLPKMAEAATAAPADGDETGALAMNSASEDGQGQDAATMAEADLGEAPGTVEDIPEGALATDRAVAEALSDGPAMPELTGDPAADALALAEALAAGVEPLDNAEPLDEGEDTTAAEAITDPVALNDDRGLARSPRPPARPVRLAAAVAAPVNVTPASASVEAADEVDPDTLAAGTRLVQLGAFESAEIARSQWEKIGGQFEDYFAGKSRVVQRAQSGGKTFYRLRAMGFEDLADARRFCSALLAKKADCIPVVVR
ncbi:SPOR domain-containing protein [Oceaniglobus roseus]|uniref:SPOR domain-containing protein n=1 Tax=Oceaniglobus roseus TaxID=1737570 RepID=UPI000C7F436C|nr:SPOR domain-containing protein [Kandeliimicrobium roseum]